MSVYTTADEYRDKAKEAVKRADIAIAELVTEVFVKGCWGSDDFKESFEDDVRNALVKMHEIRLLLG